MLQGAMIGAWEKQSLIISVTLVVLYIAAAFAWGVLDGQSDAKAQPDPDRREDLAMAWLVGGLFAGIVSGEGGMTVESARAGYTFGFYALVGSGVLLFLIAPLVQKLMHGVK